MYFLHKNVGTDNMCIYTVAKNRSKLVRFKEHKKYFAILKPANLVQFLAQCKGGFVRENENSLLWLLSWVETEIDQQPSLLHPDLYEPRLQGGLDE